MAVAHKRAHRISPLWRGLQAAECGLKPTPQMWRGLQAAECGLKPTPQMWRGLQAAECGLKPTPHSVARPSGRRVRAKAHPTNVARPSGRTCGLKPTPPWQAEAYATTGSSPVAERTQTDHASPPCGSAGRVNVTIIPFPSPGLSAQMRPPWRCTISRHRDNPRPIPPKRRVRDSSA